MISRELEKVPNGVTSLNKFGTTLFLIFALSTASAQITIRGIVSDSTSKEPVDYLLVAIFHFKTNNVATYGYTNSKGEYEIILPYTSGVFTLKARNLNYLEYSQDILLAETQSKIIDLNFLVKPRDNLLNEVVIERKRPPVLVKEDTIIYDLAQWTRSEDQTLEDVLQRIPGFEVLENGELKINGKSIGKVLIDGEEFLKGGAALSTRSISPEMVKSVEVRMDEKDSKLKESLLNTNKLVVLDIKLKEDFNKLIFGRVRSTAGYQKQLNLGGYTNLFSLRKKQKYHLLGEHDAFGNQTISLSQIQNIGREAIQNTFNLPADFNRLTDNPEFNKELYGFKDFNKANLSIAGVTTKYTLSKNTDLFIGTYNSRAKDGYGNQTAQQFFAPSELYNFYEQKNNTNYFSKNKVDIQFNTERIKINFNANAVFGNKSLSASNQFVRDSTTFLTKKNNVSSEYYQQILVEYALNKSVMFQNRSFMGVSRINSDFNLQHNQAAYSRYLYDKDSLLILDFTQKISEKRKEIGSDSRIQFQSKLGFTSLGFQLLFEEKGYVKEAFNNETNSRIDGSLFSGNTPSLKSIKKLTYLSHRFRTKKISINNKFGVANISYPLQEFAEKKVNVLEYDGSLQIDFSTENSINLSYTQKVTPFPLPNQARGYDLIDFQTFAIPQISMASPKLESQIQFSYDQVLSSINSALEIFSIYSTSKSSNVYGLNSSPFISLIYDQLRGGYFVGGAKLASIFNNLPLQIKWEPTLIFNQSENVTNTGQVYQTKTERKMMQLRILSSFEGKSYSFELNTKVSDFRFSSDLSTEANQEIFTLGLTCKQDILANKLYIISTIQNSKFWGTSTASNLNIYNKIQYAASPFNLFLEGDNLLNNKSFVKQSISPSFFSSSEQNLFGRYIRFGLEYTFK